MTEDLSSKVCSACRGDAEKLEADEIEQMTGRISDGWNVVENHHIRREFDFPDFETALEFVNEVGELAESQGHHPDIQLEWGRVEIQLYTHKIDGLHENDFIMAAKIDEIYTD